MKVKTIHQIWSNKYKPLPTFYVELSKTWKEKHPDWAYILWDDVMMESFMKMEYPNYYFRFMS